LVITLSIIAFPSLSGALARDAEPATSPLVATGPAPVPVREACNRRVQIEADEPGGAGGAWLGVEVQGLDPALQEFFDFDGDGVLVNRVVPGSPAEDAGLEKGDIILGMDGRRLREPADLVRRIRRHEPGDRVELKRFRKGRTRTVEVQLGASPERLAKRGKTQELVLPHATWSTPGVAPLLSGSYLGARVEELSPDLADYFDVEPEGGVLVLEVVEDSPAASAGLRAGDVIVEFDGEPVRAPKELVRMVRAQDPGSTVTLTMVRRGRERTIEATLAHSPMIERLRHLAHRGRDEFEPLLHDLHERLGEGREALSERVEKLEEMLRELERRVNELQD
jgi:membrane-associated protease RseP (regulator of RpoE activity)